MPEIIEHPILFSGPMVKAILEGKKTQTRRVIATPANNLRIREGTVETKLSAGGAWRPWMAIDKSPYGAVGDVLWVRENLFIDGYLDVSYTADDEMVTADEVPDWTYRGNEWHGTVPSIHMPRWASRISLEVTRVRVERLQDITEEDAIAEGVEPNWAGELSGWSAEEHGYIDYSVTDDEEADGVCFTARDSYRTLWNSINAKRGYGWDANPWVWVIEFKKVKP